MRGGPGVIVTGVLMTVDSHCSVAISSLIEGECPPYITDPPPSTEPPLPPSTDPVIDGIDTQDTGATPDTTVAGAVVAVIVINPRRACARVTVVNPRRACARGLR